jgi:DNA-directed RNA polymerase specialized sigma24 family protein
MGETPTGAGQFATTRWSLVLAAGRRAEPGADRALAALCEAYWYPLYAHARRRGLDAGSAEDRVQSFFARLLEKDGLAVADPRRGRFRGFLLAAFGHFLANEWDRERAIRRGGGHAVLSLDFAGGEARLGREPADERTPERVFDRLWALSVLDRALGRLREEYESGGKGRLFDELKPALAGDRSTPYADLAGRLGMSEGAVKMAVHRLRGRCREVLREEVAETVGSPEEVDDELRQLFAALGS